MYHNNTYTNKIGIILYLKIAYVSDLFLQGTCNKEQLKFSSVCLFTPANLRKRPVGSLLPGILQF